MKHTRLAILLTFAAMSCTILTGCGNSSQEDSASAFLPAETTAVTETQGVATQASTTAITVSATSAANTATDAASTETNVSTSVTAANTVAVTAAPQTAPPAATQPPTTEKAVGSNHGNLFAELTLGKDCTKYIESHQNFNSKDEAASCLGEGKDCSYYYNGYELYTYRDANGEILTEVDIDGKGFTDMKGAACGMTRAQIEKIYGKSSDDRYEVDGCTVEFTYQDDDTVQMIAVYKPLE